MGYDAVCCTGALDLVDSIDGAGDGAGDGTDDDAHDDDADDGASVRGGPEGGCKEVLPNQAFVLVVLSSNSRRRLCE